MKTEMEAVKKIQTERIMEMENLGKLSGTTEYKRWKRISFYEATITLMPKPQKDSTKRLQTNLTHEHWCKNTQITGK